MNSKYSEDKIIFVIINGNKYALYKHIIEKMHIFNVLHDVTLKENEYVNISYDATTEIIECVLDIIIGKNFCDPISISHLIEVVTLMKYFTMDLEIIHNMSKNYLEQMFFSKSYSHFDHIIKHFHEDNM